MDQLVVVPYPDRISLEARSIEHEAVPEGAVGLAYYHHGHVVARSAVSAEALDTIQALLSEPVSVALAAQEDEEGNIEARFCLVLPMDRDAETEGEEPDEPWKESVPAPPAEVEADYQPGEEDEEEKPQFALLPIGNVVRARDDRHHGNVAGDAREMLDNLLSGRAQDAVQKAIDDLLDSI